MICFLQVQPSPLFTTAMLATAGYAVTEQMTARFESGDGPQQFQCTVSLDRSRSEIYMESANKVAFLSRTQLPLVQTFPEQPMSQGVAIGTIPAYPD